MTLITLTPERTVVVSNATTSLYPMPFKRTIESLYNGLDKATTPKEYFCSKVVLFYKTLKKKKLYQYRHWFDTKR